VNHQPSWAAAEAERAFMARLGAGCHVPAAAYAVVDEHEIWLRALVASHDGRRILRGEQRASADNAEMLGRTVAEDLLDGGAGELLRQARTHS
jgi:hydroxymethylbilane synthase